MEMFTAAQSDPNMGDLHLDRLVDRQSRSHGFTMLGQLVIMD